MARIVSCWLCCADLFYTDFVSHSKLPRGIGYNFFFNKINKATLSEQICKINISVGHSCKTLQEHLSINVGNRRSCPMACKFIRAVKENTIDYWDCVILLFCVCFLDAQGPLKKSCKVE